MHGQLLFNLGLTHSAITVLVDQLTEPKDCLFSSASLNDPNVRVVEGEVEIGSQYHFYMENQVKMFCNRL